MRAHPSPQASIALGEELGWYFGVVNEYDNISTHRSSGYGGHSLLLPS